MKQYIFLLLFLFPILMNAQSTHLPLGNDAYHITDRLEIKSVHSVFKPYDRRDVAHFAIAADTTAGINFSAKDKQDIRYIFRDNNEWTKNAATYEWSTEKTYVDGDSVFYKPTLNIEEQLGAENDYYQLSKKPILKHFYRTPANLFELDKPNFYLKANPIIYFKYGRETGDTSYVYLNRRGFSLRGGVDDIVWFHTNLYESQERFQQHVTRRIELDSIPAVPGAGFFKDFDVNVWNTDGYDYLRGQGYVAARVSKHVNAHLGHGRHFIGDGFRSLFLSDYSNDYFYLKLNTRVWKLHYQNIFAELTSQHRKTGSLALPKKYMASHHLTFNNLLPNLNVGVFESVIFDRGGAFELQYLNPIIIYRIVEQALGSPDNIVLGINYKYNFLRRFSLYGQFMFDEFVFGELTAGDGWWANKVGLQAGLKYIDVLGIDHLDAQIEYNTVRPYTYTHDDESDANYTHYNQPLAHPLGANFKEIIANLRYQPIQPLVLSARATYANFGTDSLDTNVGINIFADNRFLTTPEGSDDPNYGHKTGQGIGNTLLIGHFTASYQVRHNMYFDLDYEYRNHSSDDPNLEYIRNYLGLSLRINIAGNTVDY